MRALCNGATLCESRLDIIRFWTAEEASERLAVTHKQFAATLALAGVILFFLPYLTYLAIAALGFSALILILGELKPPTPPDPD